MSNHWQSCSTLKDDSKMKETFTRRSFLRKGVAAVAAAIGGRATASAARKPFKRKSPSAPELIEVGVITCAYFSHIEDVWGPVMNPVGERDGTYWPRQSGMVMTTVWDADKEAAENFAKKYDLKVAKNYYDMVDKVDGVILSDFYSTGWWPQLSKPYLEAGMPTLINRPFAHSLKEAREMVAVSKANKAPILVPSADEYMFETIQARHRLQLLLQEGAKVTGVMAFEPCDEYHAHGVHGIYNVHAILEPNVVEVGMYADKWWKWGLDGALMNWKVKGKEDCPDYFVSIRMSVEYDTNGWIMISTTKGRIFVPNDFVGEDFTRFRNLFVPTIIEFQKMIETRTMPQSHEHIMAKTTTVLTGFYSNQEHGGNMVACADLPETWRAPQVQPDRIPDDIFK